MKIYRDKIIIIWTYILYNYIDITKEVVIIYACSSINYQSLELLNSPTKHHNCSYLNDNLKSDVSPNLTYS